MVPDAGYVNEGRLEGAAELGAEVLGVGRADIWKASLVKTDMMAVRRSVKLRRVRDLLVFLVSLICEMCMCGEIDFDLFVL